MRADDCQRGLAIPGRGHLSRYALQSTGASVSWSMITSATTGRLLSSAAQRALQIGGVGPHERGRLPP